MFTYICHIIVATLTTEYPDGSVAPPADRLVAVRESSLECASLIRHITPSLLPFCPVYKWQLHRRLCLREEPD